MKRILCLLLALAFGLLCLSACGVNENPWGDEIYGTYENTEGYTLLLKKGGKGSLTHRSSYGTETTEDIVFDFEKDGTLVLHGTSEAGGVIGRAEFYGMPQKAEGEGAGYTLSLRAVDSGISLATFKKITK